MRARALKAEVSPEREQLAARIEEVRTKINRLKERMRSVEQEIESFAAERERYRLLDEACRALEKLETAEAGHLFWGEHSSAEERAERLARAREAGAEFAKRFGAVESRRDALQQEIDEQIRLFDWLSDELIEQQEREENIKYEFVVDRELVLPTRPPVMPWTEEREDRERYRKSLLLSLLLAVLIGALFGVWELPLRDQADPAEIPERLVELVQREIPKPPPPPVEPKPETKKEDQPKPAPTEKQQARAKAEKSGVLAFKNAFADLIDDAESLKLGADARVTQAGQKAVGDARRSIVVAQAREGSGGINTAAISRNVGGTGGKVGGVEFTRVESSVGGLAEADRPLSDGPGPSRTDEEIQIVFDRYKAALYRIYNRELRVNPLLRGKMVLRITIEPNGEVSFCAIESSDLPSTTLKAEVVERVKRFNFGPKEGVPRITILYPIDFLPAT